MCLRYGVLTKAIAPKCKSLIATDFSASMLKRAKKKCRKYENTRFEQADILRLPYPDESFNCVVAANVIHLLDEPYRALRELDRVCKRGGRIIIPTYMNQTEKARRTKCRTLSAKPARISRLNLRSTRTSVSLPKPDIPT